MRLHRVLGLVLPVVLAASTLTLTPAVAVTPQPRTTSSLPSWSFVDLGLITDIGTPVGVSDDGVVGTTKGAWVKGTFKHIPTTGVSDYLQYVSPSGLILGRSSSLCPHICAFTWDPVSGGITPYPVPDNTAEADGSPCGGNDLHVLDADGEAGGQLTYLNASHHTTCVGGDTSKIGETIAAPGGQPTKVTQLSQVYSLTPHWALGLGTDGFTPTRLKRGDGTTTTFSALSIDQHPEALADDGAFVALTNATLKPTFVDASGTATVMPAGGGFTSVAALNDSHMAVGDDNQGGVFWPTPTSTPVELDGLGIAHASEIADAQFVSGRGDVVGTSDGNNNSNTDVYALIVASTLSASIAVTGADGQPFNGGANAVGKALDATVTLTNSSLSQTITGITVSPAMTVSPSAYLTRTGAAPTIPTSLAPGESKTYVVHFTVAKVGVATLSLTADGTEASSPVSADASTVVHLGQPLQVTWSFSRDGVTPIDTFTQLDSDDGPVATDVVATLVLKNVSDQTQHNVTLQPLDLSVLDPSAKHNPFPMSVKTGPSPSTALGDIAPGASTGKITYTLHVTNNGDFKVHVLVLGGPDPNGPNQPSTGDGILHVKPQHLLRLKAKISSTAPPLIPTGTTVRIEATVTNLDQSHALDLDPLVADFEGNVGGDSTSDGAEATDDGFVPPVVGLLAPGDEATFTVRAQSVVGGGTRAVVSFDPQGSLVNSDGTKTPLTPADLLLTSGSTPITLHLDDSGDPVPPSDFFSVTWTFTTSVLRNASLWFGNGFRSLTDVRGIFTSIGGGLVATGGLAVRSAQAAALLHNGIRAGLILSFFWAGLTDAQRQQFADECVTDLGTVDADWLKLKGGIDDAVFGYFSKIQEPLQRGDWNGFADAAGSVAGHDLPEAVVTLMPEVILGKMARGLAWGSSIAGGLADTGVAKAISLGEHLRSSKLVLKAAKSLEGVTVGDNLLANGAKVLKKQFGMAQRDIDVLSFWAKKRNLMIAVRQRNPISLSWLKKGAIQKPELIKIKNVDEIDVKYLGYLSHDEGAVVLREPIDKKLFEQRVRSAPPELRTAIAKRYGVRAKEWKKWEKKYKGWSGTKQNIGFDQVAQGGKVKKVDLREFKLDAIKVHGGDEYFRVLLANKHGKLSRITGDIDVVAITLADGRVPSAAVRAQLYDDLQEAIGMQHGETLSWILDGELLTDTKAGLLADHLPGNEILAVFGPDGIARAAYFSPTLTVFNQTTREAVATFVGAYTSTLERVGRYTSLRLAGVK